VLAVGSEVRACHHVPLAGPPQGRHRLQVGPSSPSAPPSADLHSFTSYCTAVTNLSSNYRHRQPVHAAKCAPTLCEYTSAHCHPSGNGVSSAHLFRANGNTNSKCARDLLDCWHSKVQSPPTHMPYIFQVPIWCIETPDETGSHAV
jgi:hypothetical protein